MAVSTFAGLHGHAGHRVVVVSYGPASGDETVNVAVECNTCGEVLFDVDRPPEASDETVAWEPTPDEMICGTCGTRMPSADESWWRLENNGYTTWFCRPLCSAAWVLKQEADGR